MKYLIVAAAMMTAAPALAVVSVGDLEAARIAAERNDAWHIAHLGPIVLSPISPAIELPVADSPTSAVPEPASWALMIGGFGFVGGVMRRRSAKPVAA